jgi:hypothetical protein
LRKLNRASCAVARDHDRALQTGRSDMAHVIITRDEAEREGKLPAVCMCCGAPATAFVTRRLMLKPPQYDQIEMAEVAVFKSVHALATSPYVQLRTSFCDRHRHYWTIKLIVLLGGALMFFAALLVTAAVALVATINRPEPHKGLVAIAVIVALTGLLGWLIPLLILWRKPIRVLGLEQGLIVVDNVSEAYASAVQATRPRQT